MTRTRAPFKPLDMDPLDNDIERLAREKGVGALVTSDRLQGKSSAAPAVEAAQPAAPRSRMKGLNLELPAYVWTELKIMAAHQESSVRHIVMTALRQHGLTIRSEDMVEDGRRLRSRPDSR
ncbi:MAG: hypothetical protein KIS68_03665 [Bauldia sp.]|nr:hypothetical protein [Bauldia sp.]